MLPGLVVVMLSGLTSRETIDEARMAGADGYLAKPFTSDQCGATLAFALLRHGSVLRESTEGDRSLAGGHERVRLTEREHEVMWWVKEGFADKQIPDKIGISIWTVRKHLRNVCDKRNARSRTEAG